MNYSKIFPAVQVSKGTAGMLIGLRLWIYSEPVLLTGFVSGWGFLPGFNAG